MIRSNLLSSKPGAGLLAMSGTLQKGKTEKRQSQFGLMGNPMAFFNLLNGNMPFIGGHKEKAVGGGILSLQKDLSGDVKAKEAKGKGIINGNGNMPFIGGHKEKAVGGGILSLQKGLSGKEGYKKEGGSLAGIHGPDKEAFAHFLKSCGFNEKEIAEIIDRIQGKSGPSDVKAKEAKGKGIIKSNGSSTNIGDNASSSIFATTHSNKKNFKCIPGAVGHNDNKPEIEKSLSEAGTKELSSPKTEIFHKGIGPSDKLINGNFSAFATTHSNKKNFKCIPGAVGHNENKPEIEKSLSEAETKELSNPKAEFFHKGIRPLDKLTNESFSAGENQHNITHLGNVAVDLNESDIKPQLLIKQIVEAAGKKLSNGLGRVKIKLHPPHLGILHMDVLVKDNKVHVILQTQNSDVSHILQSNVEQLKDSLHSQGLIVSNVNVSLQEESGNTGYGFGENRGLFNEGRNSGENRGDQKKEQDFLGHGSSILERKGLGLQKDGGISLFA